MSYGLPHTTDVNRALPKKAIYAKFNMNTAARDRFDEDISRLVISSEISSQSIPALAAGDIKTFYVVTVLLKRKDFDRKNIEILTKLIPQRMIIALQFEQETMLAIFNERLFFADWRPSETVDIPLKGLTLDDVWQELVCLIGGITVQEGNTLNEQIEFNEQQRKLKDQIAKLERKIRLEPQPTKKFELHKQLISLKKKLNG